MGDLHYIPPAIPPSQSSIEELFSFFTKGTPIAHKLPEPSWKPSVLPARVDKVTIDIGPGLVEVGGGLLSYQHRVFVKTSGDSRVLTVRAPKDFYIPDKELETWRARLSKLTGHSLAISILRDRTQGFTFYLPSCVARQYVVDVQLADAIRGFLTSGLFPIIPFNKLGEDLEKSFPRPVRESERSIPAEVKLKRAIGNVEFVRRGMLREDNVVERLNF